MASSQISQLMAFSQISLASSLHCGSLHTWHGIAPYNCQTAKETFSALIFFLFFTFKLCLFFTEYMLNLFSPNLDQNANLKLNQQICLEK